MGQKRTDLLAEANRILTVMEQVGDDFENHSRDELRNFVNTFAQDLKDYDTSEANHKRIQGTTNTHKKHLETYINDIKGYAKKRHREHPSELTAYLGHDSNKKSSPSDKNQTPGAGA